MSNGRQVRKRLGLVAGAIGWTTVLAGKEQSSLSKNNSLGIAGMSASEQVFPNYADCLNR
jgi:hypothetical protein